MPKPPIPFRSLAVIFADKTRRLIEGAVPLTNPRHFETTISLSLLNLAEQTHHSPTKKKLLHNSVGDPDKKLPIMAQDLKNFAKAFGSTTDDQTLHKILYNHLIGIDKFEASYIDLASHAYQHKISAADNDPRVEKFCHDLVESFTGLNDVLTSFNASKKKTFSRTLNDPDLVSRSSHTLVNATVNGEEITPQSLLTLLTNQNYISGQGQPKSYTGSLNATRFDHLFNTSSRTK